MIIILHMLKKVNVFLREKSSLSGPVTAGQRLNVRSENTYAPAMLY